MKAVEGWIVNIFGIHEEATEEELSERLSDYGDIKNLHLNLDWRTGHVKGYALVEYETYGNAKNCIDNISGTKFLGETLEADFAFAKGDKESRSFLQPNKKLV